MLREGEKGWYRVAVIDVLDWCKGRIYSNCFLCVCVCVFDFWSFRCLDYYFCPGSMPDKDTDNRLSHCSDLGV